MKIVPKLTLALFLGSSLVLAANGYFRVKREVAFFEANRARDHELIGRSLAAAVSAQWRTDGKDGALRTVDAVSSGVTRMRIEWIDEGTPRKCGSELLPLSRCLVRDETEPTWFSYTPVLVDGERRGSIQLSESATTEHIFAEDVVFDTIRATLALAFVSALLAFAMGQWLVGRPVRALAEVARRIGRGDFSGRVMPSGGDELALLAGEMNAMSDRLVATLAQLRHADRLATVGKLASGVAHELGTPLNVVSARASMIAAGETTPEESRDYAVVIGKAADRMTKIIRQLLQFARRGGPQKTTADLRALTAEALELLRPLAKKRNVELVLSRGDEDVALSVDAAQIQQVITNLVMNAIQAMGEGGNVSLAIERRRATPPEDVGGGEREFVCLVVEDEGSGIPDEVLPHVFEPFFTTKDVGEGTGLGLPVSWGIVRDHGGFISVSSTRNEGTVFTVFLPEPT